MSKLNFPIVGIGASAGGLDASIQFLSNLPPNIGMAFVLVQHLEPTHPSISVEIIARSIKLKIEEVKEGITIQKNHVYVIPPNTNMKLVGKKLSLSARNMAPGKNFPIDFFLKSLASSGEGKIIGVVLSGTGVDGTSGLQAIKLRGGITFAQDPKSARYPAMPTSAILSGAIDFVMSPEGMAKELLKMTTNSGVTINEVKKPVEIEKIAPAADQSQSPLESILALVQQRCGVDFSGYKRSTIERRLHRRMEVHKQETQQGYLEYLVNHDEETKALFDDLLIGVTEFFRKPEVYKAFSKFILPNLFTGKTAATPVRIWIPGCSTGEEAYSIAILVAEYMQQERLENHVQIFATDINQVAIQKARSGEYSESSIKKITKGRLAAFFIKTSRTYRVTKKIRDMCLFSEHDVTTDPPFSNLDLISCHNLLIYFSLTLQRKIFPRFHFALKPNGFLWLGKSESPVSSVKLFVPISISEKIFSKLPNKVLGTDYVLSHAPARQYDIVKKGIPLLRVDGDYKTGADRLMLSKFSPPSVVINSTFEILQFRGQTSPFLCPSEGQPSLNILRMARPELVSIIRSSVQAAKKTNRSVLRKDIQVEVEDSNRELEIEVIPINHVQPNNDKTFLVIFTEVRDIKQSRSKQKPLSKKRIKDQRIRELTQQLAELKEYQAEIVKQFDSSESDLLTVNEELQSTNEEFLSANEEVETAKEELQSTNEELVTVNDELLARNSDLQSLNTDLNNLLASIEIAVLIVGGDHHIRRFSPKAHDVFNLIPTDIGRPISDIKSNFDLSLSDLVSEVSSSLLSKDIEIQNSKGAWCQIRVHPFKNSDNSADGAIIAVIDIDDLKQNEIRIKKSLEYVTSMEDAVPIPVAVINSDFELMSGNRAFYKFFQIDLASVGTNALSTLQIEERQADSLRTVLGETFRSKTLVNDFEVSCQIRDGERKTILIGGCKFSSIGEYKDVVLLTFNDVSKQRYLEASQELLLYREKEARAAADQANRSKDNFLATLSHELRTPLTSILMWAQLIAEGKITQEQIVQGSRIIERSAKTQSRLINDLLDVSRITNRKLALEIKAMDPSQAITAASENVQALTKAKNIQIVIENTAGGALIYADLVRMTQIISNLLTNAIKFSPTDGKIFIYLSVVDGDHRTVQIKVVDQGKGIAPEFIPNLFKQFSQEDSSSTRLHGGLGLGLSIVQNLVTLHGGTVSAENCPDSRGACFTLKFPLIPMPSPAIVPSESRSSESETAKLQNQSAPQLEGFKVLVIEDDEGSREAVCIFLRSFGAEVLGVGSAQAGFDALSSFQPSVLVSDIAMPQEDGYSLIRRIRALAPKAGGKIPALALTAYASTDDQDRALTAGFNEHISKPVNADKLGRAIFRISQAVKT